MLARVRVKCGDNKYNNLIVPYIYIYIMMIYFIMGIFYKKCNVEISRGRMGVILEDHNELLPF